MKRALLGLAALIAVTLILFGWPWLLWRAATGPLSDFLPDLSNLSFALTHPDASGLLLALVLLAAGVAWVVTAGALVVELLTQARGVSAPRLNGFALGVLVPQTSMSRLAATALFLIPVGATIAGPANAAALAPETSTVAGESTRAVCDVEARSPVGSHTVRPGDTLWSVAEEELGDGSRYPQVFQASKRVTQPDGGRLRDPDIIRPGWRLVIPAAEDHSSRSCPQPGTSEFAAPRPTESGPDRPAADTATPSSPGARVSKPPAASKATSAPPKLDRGPDPGAASGPSSAQLAPSASEKTRAAGSDSAAPAALTTPEVRLAAVSSDRAELTWSQVPGANSYWVMVQGQSMQVPGTAVALRGLAASTGYRVEVRAMFPSGEWSKATVMQIKTAPARAARPHSTARHSSLQALRHPDARGAVTMPKLKAAESASPATRCLSRMRIALGIVEDPLVGHVGHRSEAGKSASARDLNGIGGLNHQRLPDHAAALVDLCPPHMKRNDLLDRATEMSRSWLPGTAASNIIRSGVTSVRT